MLNSRFGTVGIVEHFGASYLAFGAGFGLPALPDPTQTGTSDASRHRPDPDQVRRIERLHEVDASLYAAWRQRFEQRFEAVLTALAG